MTDQIEALTKAQEASFQSALIAALNSALELRGADLPTVSALLFSADQEGFESFGHYGGQLAIFLDADDANEGVIADALNSSSVAGALASFFAAVLALAASSVGHVANTSAGDAMAARDSAVRSVLAAYLHESALALSETIERMLKAPGSPDARAAHIRRIIGLSAAQARSLSAIRDALIAHAADPTRNGASILVATRGSITAVQRQMLIKAIGAGTSPAQAEALLDRHATALRNARAKAVAGNAVHQLAETAKLTGWQIAQRFGALPAAQKRYWQTAGDERVRAVHDQVARMNAHGVPLDQAFATPLGPCLIPPLEAGCRCKATLRPQS